MMRWCGLAKKNSTYKIAIYNFDRIWAVQIVFGADSLDYKKKISAIVVIVVANVL